MPDAPGLVVRLKRYIVELASVLGLAGMTLTNTAAPGYRQNGSDNDVYYGYGETTLGYTPAYRAAFLRSDDYDPVDLAPYRENNVPDLSHPFLGNSSLTYGSDGNPVPYESAAIEEKWNKARYAMAADLLTAIYSALDADKTLLCMPSIKPDKALTVAKAPLQGKFALYLLPPSDNYANYVLWDKAGVPFLPVNMTASATDYRQVSYKAAHAVSSRCLLNFAYTDPNLYRNDSQAVSPSKLSDRAEEFAKSFNQTLLFNQGNWDGYVIDLGDTNPEETLPLLSAVSVESAPHTAARKVRL